MVRAYHVIFTAYGFWLPNDPRGSWSDFVGSWELLKFGRATTVTTSRSLAGNVHDQQARFEAKKALKYPPVVFNGVQARAIARGFAPFIQKSDIIVHACSIMPDHVHMVIARHRFEVEQIVNLLKGAASRRIKEEDMHPLKSFPTKSGRPPKMWARGQWKVFLNDDRSIRPAIRYVEENPVREGKRRQHWSFVVPYAMDESARLSARG